jgi:hypothetical protein
MAGLSTPTDFQVQAASGFQAMSPQDQAVAQLAAELKQWVIGVNKPPGTPILPKTRFSGAPEKNYDVKNTKLDRYLQHEKQTWGINLGFTDDAKPQTGVKVARWFFARSGQNNDPIRYGETIAIGNGGDPSFIRYAKRTVGVDLEYCEKPDFQWQLLGGKPGDLVRTGESLVIFNEKEGGGECLIYFERTAGGSLGWPTSKTWTERLPGLAWDAAKALVIAYLSKK